MSAAIEKRATQHCPQTYAEMQTAARQLAHSNYSLSTIAAVLRVDVAAVRQMLGPTVGRP